MSVTEPTLIAVFAQVGDAEQIQIAEEVVITALQSADIPEGVRIDIPALSDDVPGRVVQPRVGVQGRKGKRQRPRSRRLGRKR